jgi:hypothetical protein
MRLRIVRPFGQENLLAGRQACAARGEGGRKYHCAVRRVADGRNLTFNLTLAGGRELGGLDGARGLLFAGEPGAVRCRLVREDEPPRMHESGWFRSLRGACAASLLRGFAEPGRYLLVPVWDDPRWMRLVRTEGGK